MLGRFLVTIGRSSRAHIKRALYVRPSRVRYFSKRDEADPDAVVISFPAGAADTPVDAAAPVPVRDRVGDKVTVPVSDVPPVHDSSGEPDKAVPPLTKPGRGGDHDGKDHGEGKQSQSKSDWAKIGVVVAVVGVVVAVGGLVVVVRDLVDGYGARVQKLIRDHQQIRDYSIVASFKDPVTLFNEDYIPRADVDKKLKVRNFITHGRYSIVVGPKGSGKSTSVAHALNGQPWVKLIKVSSELTAQEFRDSVKDALGLKSYPTFLQENWRDGHPMTIVFDVETGPSDELITAIRYRAKDYSEYANMIIILSETNLVMEYNHNPREKFVWVGELTIDEARALVAAKIESDATVEASDTVANMKADMEKFIHEVGRNPVKLTDCVKRLKEGEKIDEIISKEIRAATCDIAIFPFKPIIEALKAHPDGVHLYDFGYYAYEGRQVDLSYPEDVAPVMQSYKAIVYHYPTKEYRPYSTAHATALKKMKRGG